jgi:hypothetical protein
MRFHSHSHSILTISLGISYIIVPTRHTCHSLFLSFPFSTYFLTSMPTHKHAVQCGAALDMQCIGSEALQLTQSSLEVGNNVMFKVFGMGHTGSSSLFTRVLCCLGKFVHWVEVRRQLVILYFMFQNLV